MSEELRKLNEMLEEVDKFFDEKGIFQTVESFLSSEQVTAKVTETTNLLIGNMKKMEDSAPNDTVRGIAKTIREGFENNQQSLADDVVASFKVRLAGSLQMMLAFTGEIANEEIVLNMVKRSIPTKGMEDINDICSEMLSKNSNSFMRKMYSGYLPPEIPEEIAGLIRALFGDVMIPFTVIFPDLDEDTSSSNT